MGEVKCMYKNKLIRVIIKSIVSFNNTLINRLRHKGIIIQHQRNVSIKQLRIQNNVLKKNEVDLFVKELQLKIMYQLKHEGHGIL